MISVEVTFFAQLKDFFGEKISIELPQGTALAEIRNILARQNALAFDWLKISRFASENAFLAEDFKVVAGGRYFFLPPSSGG